MAESKRRGKRSQVDVFGLNTGTHSWLSAAGGGKPSSSAKPPSGVAKPRGRAYYVGQGADPAAALAKHDLPRWLIDRALKKRGEAVAGTDGDGPVWILLPLEKRAGSSHGGLLDPSPYGVARDVTALAAGVVADYGLGTLELKLTDATDDEAFGALVGLEMGAYKFKMVRQPKPGQELPRLVLPDFGDDVVARAASLGLAVNLARHLVNVPAGELNPATMADAVTRLFAGSQSMSVDVWTGKRLEKERLGLLRAVGDGATFGPALIHLAYRPKGKAKTGKPLAFVGKGITFDTGGLDLKDSGGMRLMKKDMGGSASLVGLAAWAEWSGYEAPLDFYLAVAENAVDKDAYHPGDIIVSRAGQTVEIDNTDAEGRLVLADALDVAIGGAGAKGKDGPEAVIDLATLTGAMRVALGTRIAGMFATDDGLADAFLQAAQLRGEPAWRMPLYGEYLNNLRSVVADIANSGPSRFGGAITAALFLQKFVGTVPWLHVDMYAWTDPNLGGCTETGGSGQMVQALSAFLAGRHH